MRVVVLGAGLIGVSTAWQLARDGHQVTVVDRQPEVARETSYANGGQISTSHAEPWANPETPLKALRWLGREDSPLLWRLRADAAQWSWGLRFLGECRPGRTRANTIAILRLALYSRDLLKELRPALGLEYDQRQQGILHLYSDVAEFEHAIPQAALMRDYGCDRVVKSAAECLAIEPALAESTVPIVGGTYTADDESGDARKFAMALARRAAAATLPERLQVADLSFDTATYQVRRQGVAIDLPPTPLRLLEALMRASPRVLDRPALERAAWGDNPPDSDALRAHLHLLRAAIDKPFDRPLLHTLKGLGWQLADADARTA